MTHKPRFAPLRLCLDNVIYSLQSAGGISVYWTELWTRMLRDDVAVSAIEAAGAGQNLFRGGFTIPPDRIHADHRPLSIGRYLAAPLPSSQAYLMHSSYYRIAASPKLPMVQSCYDFTYERFRHGPARWTHSWQKRRALTAARGVICISESTRNDLLHYCPRVREEDTCVIHLGYSEAFRRLPRGEAEGLAAPHMRAGTPYALFVGDRSAYKNFSIAVDAVACTKGHHLLVVGGGPPTPAEAAQLKRRLYGRFTHIDRAPVALLNALYNTAQALIYPSAYEGFGLPVLEAMAAGCPVIAIDASSLPEVAGTAGLLIDRPDADAAAAWLERLEDETFRDSVIADGLENVRRFSWERCYQETMAFYARILDA